MSKRAADAPVPYRTLETAHFRIKYSLYGVNRIKTFAEDSGLLRLADSLARISPGRGSGAGDAAFVSARLDAVGAPHPRYATVMSVFFEQARADYVDRFGMRAPVSVGNSYYYQAPAGGDGKYSVDIADVGTAEPHYRGLSYYALTFPAAKGSMVMENDFLFNARIGPDGIPQGDSITSKVGERLIHNYVVDWQAGLQVTCFHEFYHAVQFAYTPDPEGPHVWYETGATAMEERNAPDVNDYLQYLPEFFDALPEVGMFDYGQGSSCYGNAIFHRFLAHELGEAFDAAVWSRLAENGNDLPDALSRVGSAQGKTLSRLYSGFAQQLAFSGLPVRPPFRPFSPDLPSWPRLRTQRLDITALNTYQTPAQAPLTITAWNLVGAAGSGKSAQALDPALVPVLAFADPDSSQSLAYPGSVVGLDFPDLPGRTNMLLFANGSVVTAAGARILALQSVPSANLFAYPNPVRFGDPGARLYFSRLPRASEIGIFSEAGLPVRLLGFTPDSALWSWDMKDANGAGAKPGVYYYRENGGPASAVLLLR